MPHYYDTIRNPSTFSQRARGMANFNALCQTQDWQRGVSNWGVAQLYASRVICTQPTWRLSLLDGFFPDNPRGTHACINNLIDGPGNVALADLHEPQIVQRYHPDSLGYVWAALAPFLRAENASHGIGNPSTSSDSPPTPERPRRQITQTVHPGYVPSDSFAAGSSPERAPSISAISQHSIGYTEPLSAPLLEDATIRLSSCFIRCVLNYAQPADKQGPLVHFRDERLAYSYETCHDKDVEAIDDGGVQLYYDSQPYQVALLEGKRTFQAVENGTPCVTDKLLAQMVGEAMALQRSSTNSIPSDNIIVILAVTHCIKFFCVELTEDFLANYETLSPSNASENNFLRVDSTEWFSIKLADHRAEIVSHLLALIAWADAALPAE